MLAHLILGVVFTFNLLGFIVLAPDRFALILRACLEWDRNTIFWFRNFGGGASAFRKGGVPFDSRLPYRNGDRAYLQGERVFSGKREEIHGLPYDYQINKKARPPMDVLFVADHGS